VVYKVFVVVTTGFVVVTTGFVVVTTLSCSSLQGFCSG